MIWLAVFLVVAWFAGNAIAWLDYRLRFPNAPFNWRIFCGANVYINWEWKKNGR